MYSGNGPFQITFIFLKFSVNMSSLILGTIHICWSFSGQSERHDPGIPDGEKSEENHRVSVLARNGEATANVLFFR